MVDALKMIFSYARLTEVDGGRFGLDPAQKFRLSVTFRTWSIGGEKAIFMQDSVQSSKLISRQSGFQKEEFVEKGSKSFFNSL
jgi:hypothetical protein